MAAVAVTVVFWRPAGPLPFTVTTLPGVTKRSGAASRARAGAPRGTT